MADVVQILGRDGQSFAEKFLGWGRPTIRKGIKELESSVTLTNDAFAIIEKNIERG